MTYFEYLNSIDDSTIKKKKKISIGNTPWHIGRMDGGAHGACDKYQERFAIFVPSNQKPSMGPRIELTLFLKKRDGSNQVEVLGHSPLLLSLTRHATEKYGCKAVYPYSEAWDCQTHLVGKLCEIGEPDFEAVINSLLIEDMVRELEQFAKKVNSAQPYKSGKQPDYNFIRLENLDRFLG